VPQDRYGVRDLAAPWYAGSASFPRAPWVPPSAVPAGDVAIVGMPVDQFATSVGHTGMRLGPRRIREASLFLAGYHGIQAEFDLSGRTGQLAVDALLAVIQHRVFERAGELPADQLAAVLFRPDAR
jgi:arginase family enzyme